MSDVVLTSAVRNNLLSLQNTTKLMDQTQNRLATGKAVNSALDNPTNFFTASSLDARAGDLNRLLDQVGNSVQTLQAADEGLSAITDLVEAAQASARQALQAAGPTTDMVASALGDESFDADAAASDTSSELELATVISGNAVLEGEDDLTDVADIADGNEIVISFGGTDFSITIDETAANADFSDVENQVVHSDEDLLQAINNISGLSGEFNDDGELVVTASNGEVVELAFLDDQGDPDGDFADALGFDAGEFSNLLNDDLLEQGNTVQFEVGGETLSFDIGTGAGEVATIQDLVASIDATDELSAEINDDNELVITATSSFDTITVQEDSSDLGFDDTDPHEPTNLLTQGVNQGDELTIQIGDDAAQTVTFGDDADEGEVGTREGLVAALEGMGLEAEFTDDGELSIRSVSEDDMTVSGSATDALGLTAETVEAQGEQTPNSTRQNAEDDFNRMLTQINELAADASFNGVNLINGDDLTVIFNEDGSSSLTIEGVNFDSAGLGINEAATDAFQNDTNIEATLDELDAAINDLRAQAATFGSNLSVVESRENFTNNMVNVLETGAANLTLADTNEEGANMMALQTRQQLSTVSLSMASQADQNVLRLF